MSLKHMGWVSLRALRRKLIEILQQRVIVVQQMGVILLLSRVLRLSVRAKTALRGLILVQNLNVLVEVGLALIHLL